MAKRNRKVPVAPDAVASKAQHSPKRRKLNQSKPNPPWQPKATSTTEPDPEAREKQIKHQSGALIPTDPTDHLDTSQGLTKRARKRRRLRERKHAALASGQHLGSSRGIDSNQTHQPRQDSSKSNTLPEEDVQSLFQQITRTVLVRKPFKQWQLLDDCSYGGTEAGFGAQRDVDGGTRLASHEEVSAAAQTCVPEEAQTLKSKTKSSEAQMNDLRPRSPVLGDASNNRSPSMPSASQERRPSEGSTAGLGSPAIKASAATSTALCSNNFLRSPPRSLQVSSDAARKSLRSIRMELNSLGTNAKPLSSMKANTVPTYSNSSDIQSAFKRFDNFANGRTGSDSEDESEESEESDSDSEVAGDPAPRRICQIVNLIAVEEKQASNPPQASSSNNAPNFMPSTANPNEDELRREAAEEVHSYGGKDTRENNGNSVDSGEVLFGPRTTNGAAGDAAGDFVGVEDPGEDQCIADESAENDKDLGPPRDENTCGPPYTEEDMDDGDAYDGAQPPSCAGDDIPEVTDEILLSQQLEREMSAVYPQPDLETDLPLFSAFSAATTPRSSKKRSRESNFTRQSLSGPAPASNQMIEEPDATLQEDHEQLAAETTGSTPALSDYEADDGLFRSIEDISLEIFGATRNLPFGKPRLNSQIGEKLALTDISSDKRLDSAAPFGDHFVRSSSPIVYICHSTQPDVSATPTRHGAQATPHDQGEEVSAPIDTRGQSASSSPLSELSRSPTPPSDVEPSVEDLTQGDDMTYDDAVAGIPDQSKPSAQRKRKMTGITSKHFSPQKTPKPSDAAVDRNRPTEGLRSHNIQSSPTRFVTPDTKAKKPKKRNSTAKKSTAKESEFFTPAESPSQQLITEDATPVPKKRRVPAGTSTSIVPPTTQQYFGLIQEKLWDQPFWLMIAVTFLNKTAGKTAAPIFWKLKEQYQTPEALSEANVDDLVDMIYHLGLQTQRAKRLVSMAKTWSETPPAVAQRYRTLHYPVKGDGKGIKPNQVVEEDSEGCDGALEIGHIPGCGPYAWDSWRIFCRDVLRGVAEDFNGKGAGEVFVPEWQRVLPLDKELRACLRWMWLREGWTWDCESGEKRRATEEEVERGRMGEMEIMDQQERKFAEQAADVEEKDDPMSEATGVDDQPDVSGVDAEARTPIKKRRRKIKSIED